MKNKILILLCLVVFSTGAFAYTDKFRETSATFTITKTDVRKIANNSVLASLIKSSGQEVSDLVDDSGTKILLFEVKYSAPVELAGESTAKSQQIVQYGLFNNLNPELKSTLGKAIESPINIKIGYDELDPIDIQFVINGALYQPPLLLTDTIDKNWQKK